MMKSKKPGKQIKLTFKEAVEATPDIADCYKPGLQALGRYSNKVEASDTRLLQGSVEIDKCTEGKYPGANRWDYVLAYNAQVYFVEVHSANSSEVKTLIKKLEWLKNWLCNSAPEIEKLTPKNKEPYYWIHSGKFAIPKTASQYRNALEHNLIPVSILKLV